MGMTYTPESSAGWLDLDAAASERVSLLIRSLEESGTLDALGLLSVRGVISDILNPGTSTIQTRLRYFVFLPWIFTSLEAQQVPSHEFTRRLRDREARLIDCLRHLGPEHGVIGYSAGRELKRMPSEIYWGGLGSWGLRRIDYSLAEYGRLAAVLGRQRDRDDDGNVTVPAVAMWSEMPEPPRDFLESEISFELREGEAQLLAEHIRQRHPESLLAAMSATPEDGKDRRASMGSRHIWPLELPSGSTAPRAMFLGAHSRPTAPLQRAACPQGPVRIRVGYREARSR